MQIKLCRGWLTVKGGAERVVLELANHLSQKHEVEFITNYYDQEKTFSEFKNFDVKIYPTGFPYKWKLSRALGSALFFSNLKLDADLIIADLSPAHWLARKNHNVLWYCHTPLRDSYDLLREHVLERPFYLRDFYRLSAHIYTHFDQKIVPKVKHICVNSKVTQDRVKQYYNRESQIIHPGVHPREFHCGDFQKYFLWVGRDEPHKRRHLAEDAFRLFHATEYSLRTITGGVPDTELREAYANCYAYVYTSKNEEWSLSILEAMASGKPVLAVNEGCATEIVDHRVNGLLVNPDSVSIAKAMKYLVEHPDEAERMGKNARKKVEERYTWRIFGDGIEKVVDRFK